MLWIRWKKMVEIKHFVDVVSIMPCQNSSWIMDWRIFGEGRSQIPVSSLDRSSGTRSRIDRVYTDINIASNTKINHIMIAFTDHYYAIYINRFPSKTKTGKDSWYFNNSLLCKPEFSLTTKTFLFLLKTQNTTTLQLVTGGNTLNLV